MNLKLLYRIILKSFSLLGRSNPMILAASTAFFATFSLPPIIIILINTLGLCFRSDKMSEEIFNNIRDVLGNTATTQIETIANNFIILEGKGWIAAGVFLFFVFTATTLLVVIHNSIHILWRISNKRNNKIRASISERIKAAGLIVSIGLLFLVSLLFDASLVLIRENLEDIFHSNLIFFLRILQFSYSFSIVTTWFTLVFKILPNAFVPWKVALQGGLVTGLLFNIGKIILGKFLVHGQISTVFGASGSFALILLFIFYSSFIFYFGASFTYVFAKVTNNPIKAGKYADKYEEMIVSEKD